jgi:hypothetical protein
MSRNSRNPFSKVSIGTKFVISSTAAFKHDWDYETGETHKRWYNFPLSDPMECYFVGTKTLYEGNVVGTAIYDEYTEEDLPGRSKLVNRSARWAAMFIPISGVQYRAPMMALVDTCAMDGCNNPVVGHTCCPKCAEFLDSEDKPAYHDDSGDFLEPSDFMLEELEMDYDAMYRIFGEVAYFDIGDVVESWGNDAQWKEAWEYGYLVGHEDLPYRPFPYTTRQEGPYDWDLRWHTPMHKGFESGLWQGEVDRKAGKPADWNIYIPF